MSLVRLTEPATGVRLLLLDNPAKRNALGSQMRAALADAVAQVAADRAARALVITGMGSAFCSGADVPSLLSETGRDVAALRDDLREVYRSFLAVRDLAVPVIAAVQGPAVGAGANLALACDIVVAGPGARFDFPFTKLGLHPGGGATYFLVTAAGRQRALKILLEGGSVTAQQAVEYGLAVSVAEDPVHSALALAGHVASLDPGLVRDMKSAVSLAAESGLAASLHFESWAQAATATSERVKASVATREAGQR
jgi:enoyl-CoA hydratase